MSTVNIHGDSVATYQGEAVKLRGYLQRCLVAAIERRGWSKVDLTIVVLVIIQGKHK
jgi:hypothetical protein